MRFFNVLSLTAAALVATPGADARRRRSSRTRGGSSRVSLSRGVPTGPTYSGEPVHKVTTASHVSQATCNVTVSASTTSTAMSAYTDLVKNLSKDLCTGFRDVHDNTPSGGIQKQAEAIANLVLDSRITCDTEGKSAVACGAVWAGADSWAEAGYDVLLHAIAEGQLEGNCECGLDTYAGVEVDATAYGEVWARIWASLDDGQCAGSGDDYWYLPSSVDKSKVVNCTAEVIFATTAKLVTDVWERGNCKHQDKYTECFKCCVDKHGNTIDDCYCDEYLNQCNKKVRSWVKARAVASITGHVEEKYAFCKTNNTNYIEAWTKTRNTPRSAWGYDADYTYSGNVRAECSAMADGTAYADATSGTADAYRRLVKRTCRLPLDVTKMRPAIEATAAAVANVYDLAWTKCQLRGGDLEYDGGCALASAFSAANAEACANATAVAIAGINFGHECECNADASAIGAAVANDVHTIFAFVEQEVFAKSCSENTDNDRTFADFARRCTLDSVADLSAKAVMRILREADCIAPSKEEHCDKQVQLYYSKDDPEWADELQQCMGDADVKAGLLVDAIAKIDITSTQVCNTLRNDTVGDLYSEVGISLDYRVVTPGTEVTPDADVTA